jgi:hypothetical protein
VRTRALAAEVDDVAEEGAKKECHDGDGDEEGDGVGVVEGLLGEGRKVGGGCLERRGGSGG